MNGELDHPRKYEVKPRRDRWVYIGAALVLVIAAAVLYWNSVQREEERNDALSQADRAAERAETAEEFAMRVAKRCATEGDDGPLHRQGLCSQAEAIEEEAEQNPIDNLDPDDPDPNDPEVDDPDPNDPERQDPEIQDPEIQDPEIQDPEVQDPEIDDPDPDDPDPDDPEQQDPEIDDPDPNDPPVCEGRFVCDDELGGYATEEWVLALIRALGCEVTAGENGPPLVFTCTVTGKP